MPITIDRSLVAQCNPEHVWRHFQDITRWPEAVPRIIALAFWTSGEPWQQGSKFEMKLLQPMPSTARPEILECIPATHVRWMAAGSSLSVEQWFRFEQLPEGTTRISAAEEFTGPMTFMFGETIQKQVAAMYDEWLGVLKLQAEQTARDETATSI